VGAPPGQSAVVGGQIHGYSDATECFGDKGNSAGAAEGVEDEATWRALDALGCDAIQGYHVSRPVPPDDLIHWLERQQAATQTPQPHH